MNSQKPFIHDDFLLSSETAKVLYHSTAEKAPIIDYHSHLNPQQIATNQQAQNITQLWLAGDHYKWRAMRTCGISEKFITGDATDQEKFFAWSSVVPRLLKNPLYHWTHLELKAYFGITTLLDETSAPAIWEQTSQILQSPNHGARDLLLEQNVQVVCTTDDPIDDLKFHQQNNLECQNLKIYPTWRPEKAMKIQNPQRFKEYLNKLAQVVQVDPKTMEQFDSFLFALEQRHQFFADNGCRISDYSVESFVPNPGKETAHQIYNKTLQQQEISTEEAAAFASFMLEYCAQMDAHKNWVRQLHIGALRNPNQRAFEKLGPDTGFDAINDFSFIYPLSVHLSNLEKKNALPRTLIYNLNPKDNTTLAVLCGSFQDGTPGGKINFGPAWWFLDQLKGMQEQLETLSQLSCFSQFLGMLTDSRSILSMPRHDYFRRLLCNMLGEDVKNGIIPDDIEKLKEIVSQICYKNAKNYFNF